MTLLQSLHHKLTELAWSILEFHQRHFGPFLNPSALPDDLGGKPPEARQ